MKSTAIRCGVFCVLLTLLCVGAVFQYLTAEKAQKNDAVLVMAYLTDE